MSDIRTKRMKDEVRQLMHLTRPPRLEGAVKEAMMEPIRKQKRLRTRAKAAHKPQGYSAQERKDYQLSSKHHG